MATFGPTITDAPEVQNFTTPKEGIVKEPVVIKGLTSLFNQATDLLASKNKSKNDVILADFTAQQLALIDSVEQGQSSAWARTQIRNNLKTAVLNFPGLRDDFLKANADVLGISGLGEVVQEGNDDEQRRKKMKDSLYENGLIGDGATEEQVDQAEENFRLSAEADRRFKRETDTIALERAKIGLTTDQIGALDAREKKVADDYLSGTAGTRIDLFERKAKDLMALKGTEGYDEATILKLVDQEWAAFQTEMAPFLGKSDTSVASAMSKVFELRKDILVKQITGEYSSEAAKRETDIIQSGLMAAAMKDPTLSGAWVASKVAPNIPYNGQQGVAKAVGDLISRNMTATEEPANPLTDTPEGKRALKTYLNGISDLDMDDEAAVAEQTVHLTNIFNGLEDFNGVMVRNPKAAIEMMDFIATPAFLAMLQSNDGNLPNKDVVTELLKANYEDEVWGMVRKQFLDKSIITDWVDPNTPIAKIGAEGFPDIEVSSKSTIGVRPSASGIEFYAISGDPDTSVKAEIKRLNRDLLPVVNNTIKAFAHLDGSNNYQKQAELVMADLFQNEITESSGLSGGDANDDLELKDFNPDYGEPLPIGSDSGITGGAGYTTITTPDGEVIKRTGARNWRNNNPGNIEWGSFAKSKGAIGSDGRFAVFPDYETGRQAKEDLLFKGKGYKGKTIEEAIARYAPAFENDSAAYSSSIAAAAGVTTDTLLSDLTPEQRKKLLDQMQVVEGWKVGKETVVQ